MYFGTFAFFQILPSRLPFGVDLILPTCFHELKDASVLLRILHFVQHPEEVIVRHRSAHIIKMKQDPPSHRVDALRWNDSAIQRKEVCLSCWAETTVNDLACKWVALLRANLGARSEKGPVIG